MRAIEDRRDVGLPSSSLPCSWWMVPTAISWTKKSLFA